MGSHVPEVNVVFLCQAINFEDNMADFLYVQTPLWDAVFRNNDKDI